MTIDRYYPWMYYSRSSSLPANNSNQLIALIHCTASSRREAANWIGLAKCKILRTTYAAALIGLVGTTTYNALSKGYTVY
jgi:hypothetical protein